MFAGNVNLVPGQEFRNFSVLEPDSRTTKNGREISNGFKEVGKIKGILAQAKPSEIERWRQLEHPVTHKIIQQGPPFPNITAGWVLEYGGRHFSLQTEPYNPGNINHWTIYYCVERIDAQ